MRILLLTMVCAVAISVVGCAGAKSTGVTAKPALIVTRDSTLLGKVAFVNPASRYVVLNFPSGRVAVAGQVLHVFRDRVKVGELKVNALQRDENVVADITAGEAQVGDQVKDR